MEKRELVCWKCGVALADIPLPLSRFAECKACRAALHVCRMCEFYDTSVAKSCREPVAEEVKDKTRANFCDYLRARPDAYAAPDHAEAAKARSDLHSLFGLDSPASGGSPTSQDAARNELDALFGLDKKK